MAGTTAKLDEYVSKADATMAEYASVTQYGEFDSFVERLMKLVAAVAQQRRRKNSLVMCEFKLLAMLYCAVYIAPWCVRVD